MRNDSSNSQSQPTILRLKSTSVSTSALNLISSLQLVLNLGIQIQLHLPLQSLVSSKIEQTSWPRCTMCSWCDSTRFNVILHHSTPTDLMNSWIRNAWTPNLCRSASWSKTAALVWKTGEFQNVDDVDFAKFSYILKEIRSSWML